MELHSQPDGGIESHVALEGQLRESYGRVVYSHKTHEKCADILLSRLALIKGLQIVLSAVTTAGFIGAVLGAGTAAAVAGIVVSTALLTLNAYTKDYDLGELAQKHKQAASELWVIREKYLSLLVDLAASNKSAERMVRRRNHLIEELHAVYGGAPCTTFRAYKMAQRALKQLDDMTFADAEVDAFLPKALKRAIDITGPAEAPRPGRPKPAKGGAKGAT